MVSMCVLFWYTLLLEPLKTSLHIYRLGAEVLDWLLWSECLLPSAEKSGYLPALLKCQALAQHGVSIAQRKPVKDSIRRLWKRTLSQVGHNVTSLVGVWYMGPMGRTNKVRILLKYTTGVIK